MFGAIGLDNTPPIVIVFYVWEKSGKSVRKTFVRGVVLRLGVFVIGEDDEGNFGAPLVRFISIGCGEVNRT